VAKLVNDTKPITYATVIASESDLIPIGKRFAVTEEMESFFEPKQLEEEATRQSSILTLDDYTLFVEVIQPDIELVIFGAGYDALPLVSLGKQVGFQVTVTDECIAHITPKRFHEASCLIYSKKEEFSDKLPVTKYSAAILLSHSYYYDKEALAYLLTTDVGYIGILGPKKRGQKMIDELAITDEKQLERIHYPVGLDIGAETPEEVALSIVAEVKAFFSKRKGGKLSYRDAGIH
jgi:xanthine dehydrogenase accessory factor